MKKMKLIISLSLIVLMIFASTSVSFAGDDNELEIVRFAGNDRFETANIIADEVLKSNNMSTCDTVVIANAYNFADCLAGGPLAKSLKAPILLSNKDKIETSTLNKIKKLGATKVYILGGKSAISDKVVNQLTGIGIKNYRIIRLAGNSRYETAVVIAQELMEVTGKTEFSNIFVVSGENFPDALSISPIAGIKQCPILYAPKKGNMDAVTFGFINSLNSPQAYIIGSSTIISDNIKNRITYATGNEAERIYGNDRYETSAKIFKKFNSFIYDSKVCIATGTNFPDALAGSVYAASESYGILLVDNKSVNQAINYTIRGYNTERAYVFGGQGAVSDSKVKTLTRIVPTTGKKTEVVFMGSVRNPYEATEGESTRIEANVEKVTYTITKTSSGRLNIKADITWKTVYSSTTGQLAVKANVRLYNQNNHKLYDSKPEKGDTNTVFTKKGETFVTTYTFESVAEGVYELFIYDLKLSGMG